MKRFRNIFSDMTVRMMLTAGMLLVSMVSVAQEETGVVVHGNVYGGGNLGDVGTHVDQATPSVGNYDWKDKNGTPITSETDDDDMTGISKVTITSEKAEVWGNVFGGGKGEAMTFECEKGMVYQTKVEITKGTVGTLVGTGQSQTLRAGTGNVYGGGEVSRVEGNTMVEIGAAGTMPVIRGSVFGAGAGIETHGYSALVRGTSTVTIQGNAQVWHNVYGGGAKASVGRYKVKTPANAGDSDVPATLPYGMPAHLLDGGVSTVIIKGNAAIGNDDIDDSGHVYGGGQGIEPRQDYDYVSEEDYSGEGEYKIDEHKPGRMISGNTWEYFAGVEAYHQFVETLALSGKTDLTITGDATVKGTVFGGSESGFVYKSTFVKIQNGTVYGDVFGGGRGLDYFAEAGRVSENTNLTVSGGEVKGNVYGGGSLGDVGTIKKNFTTYNYQWIKSGSNGNVNAEGNNNDTENNRVTYAEDETNRNTGVCTVTISGGIIGLASTNDPQKHGNVFGAGRGEADTFWCEKAMAFATNVNVSAGVVNGSVYGGGEVGRVEDDSNVTIGTPNGKDIFEIKGDVFGAGAGKETHGYSALLRGNTIVTVQGNAIVDGSVFGGGEKASVGKFILDENKLPSKPDTGGDCTVTIQGNAQIGSSGTGHNVFGAGQGVTPNWIYDVSGNYDDRMNNSKRMVTYDPYDPQTGKGRHKTEEASKMTWEFYEDDHAYVWEYYSTKSAYLAYLETLALASHPAVTISGNATVNGSVYGGGQRGITLGKVEVSMTGGTVKKDVYGGGALADTNKGNWNVNNYVLATALNTDAGELITDLYTRTGAGTNADPYKYTKVTDSDASFSSGMYYRQVPIWANAQQSAQYKTSVSLTGGTINGDAYGGALGDEDTPAYVYGDILVDLNGTTTVTQENGNDVYSGNNIDSGAKGCIVSRIFGCNNVNGTPKGKTVVYVHATQNKDKSSISEKYAVHEGIESAETTSTYDVASVYGGGNLAPYEPVNAWSSDEDEKTKASPCVIIDGCDLSSIKQVYGGGNAASSPATNITINGTWEIEDVFGGGDGHGYMDEAQTIPNPGANVGYIAYSTDYDPPRSSKEERIEKFSYGSGKASVNITGGKIHRVFGGSNTKGNVRESAVTILQDMDGCHFQIDEAYGGGKEAPMDAEAILMMECIPGLKYAYGGAQDADVMGGVLLNITNGTFDRVFGGNNVSGTIQGPIVVNVEETGCRPIIIGELYGGGNQAAYSTYGYDNVNNVWVPRETPKAGVNPYEDPQVNVKSFTSIGNIYGGGLGSTAKMVGNPHVNINVTLGKYSKKVANSTDPGYGTTGYMYDDKGYIGDDDKVIDGHKVIIPPHVVDNESVGNIGVIQNVFGGGNAAPVLGNTDVTIGTLSFVPMVTVDKTDVRGYYYLNNSDEYVEVTGESPVAATANTTYYKPVIGADIRGDVYGGGNAAAVTGNANVTIGKRKE